jgi:hypothetical protein
MHFLWTEARWLVKCTFDLKTKHRSFDCCCSLSIKFQCIHSNLEAEFKTPQINNTFVRNTATTGKLTQKHHEQYIYGHIKDIKHNFLLIVPIDMIVINLTSGLFCCVWWSSKLSV